MPLSISQRRILLLIAATTVSLSSGTNYLFSAYAPQLGSQLHLSSTQLNLIGIAGNLGVYTSGPVWGVFIDRRGPRGVLLCAAGLVAAGYGGVRWIYLTHATAGKASSGTVWALAGCMLMTGYAASAGLGASINTVARSFPSSSRATATGITLAGFGLSAFLFSTVAHVLFEGRTEAFLALLAVGTAAGMLIGVVGVRPIHYVVEEGYAPVAAEDELLDAADGAVTLTRSRSTEVIASDATPGEDLEVSKHLEEVQVVPVEVTGTALFRSLDFWIITAILALRTSPFPSFSASKAKPTSSKRHRSHVHKQCRLRRPLSRDSRFRAQLESGRGRQGAGDAGVGDFDLELLGTDLDGWVSSC